MQYKNPLQDNTFLFKFSDTMWHSSNQNRIDDKKQPVSQQKQLNVK